MPAALSQCLQAIPIELRQSSLEVFFACPLLHILRQRFARFAACSVSVHKRASQPAVLRGPAPQVPFGASRDRRTVRGKGHGSFSDSDLTLVAAAAAAGER